MLLRLAICRLRGDSKGLGVLQIPPEGELCVFLKKVRGKDRLARARRDLFVHTMKPIEPELGVELRGVVVHGLEVMLVRFFTKELIDQLEDLSRSLRQHAVFHDDESIGKVGVAGLTQRLVRKAHEAVGTSKRFHSLVNGGSLIRVAEDTCVLKDTAAKLEKIQNLSMPERIYNLKQLQKNVLS